MRSIRAIYLIGRSVGPFSACQGLFWHTSFSVFAVSQGVKPRVKAHFYLGLSLVLVPGAVRQSGVKRQTAVSCELRIWTCSIFGYNPSRGCDVGPVFFGWAVWGTIAVRQRLRHSCSGCSGAWRHLRVCCLVALTPLEPQFWFGDKLLEI